MLNNFSVARMAWAKVGEVFITEITEFGQGLLQTFCLLDYKTA